MISGPIRNYKSQEDYRAKVAKDNARVELQRQLNANYKIDLSKQNRGEIPAIYREPDLMDKEQLAFSKLRQLVPVKLTAEALQLFKSFNLIEKFNSFGSQFIYKQHGNTFHDIYELLYLFVEFYRNDVRKEGLAIGKDKFYSEMRNTALKYKDELIRDMDEKNVRVIALTGTGEEIEAFESTIAELLKQEEDGKLKSMEKGVLSRLIDFIKVAAEAKKTYIPLDVQDELEALKYQEEKKESERAEKEDERIRNYLEELASSQEVLAGEKAKAEEQLNRLKHLEAITKKGGDTSARNKRLKEIEEINKYVLALNAEMVKQAEERYEWDWAQKIINMDNNRFVYEIYNMLLKKKEDVEDIANKSAYQEYGNIYFILKNGRDPKLSMEPPANPEGFDLQTVLKLKENADLPPEARRDPDDIKDDDEAENLGLTSPMLLLTPSGPVGPPSAPVSPATPGSPASPVAADPEVLDEKQVESLETYRLSLEELTGYLLFSFNKIYNAVQTNPNLEDELKAKSIIPEEGLNELVYGNFENATFKRTFKLGPPPTDIPEFDIGAAFKDYSSYRFKNKPNIPDNVGAIQEVQLIGAFRDRMVEYNKTKLGYGLRSKRKTKPKAKPKPKPKAKPRGGKASILRIIEGEILAGNNNKSLKKLKNKFVNL